MSNSSQPPDYLTTYISDYSDDVTIKVDDSMFITGSSITNSSIGTITIPTSYGSDTITLTGSGSGSYTLNSSDFNINWGVSEEWVDAFPDWHRVQDMCKKYPGLEIALRNFRTVYTLVKDDYDNPKDEK